MFIIVKLLNGFQKLLTYKIPDSWDKQSLKKGTVVVVPLRTQRVHALIIELQGHPPRSHAHYAIKEALSIEAFPKDSRYLPFINYLAHYYRRDMSEFLSRIKRFVTEEASEEIINQGITPEAKFKTITLTDEQKIVVDFISTHIDNPTFKPTVVHGVTGSGKTEVYKKCIEHAYTHNKTTILLLPEVTLAVEFENLLKQALTEKLPILSFHSATSTQDKRTLWKMLLQGQPLCIIGVHLPILLPIANLGLIIIDEEHEVGYQEKKHPKINTKEAALIRAHMYQLPIILGSATPSITTLYNVYEKGWTFFELKKRFAGAFPKIQFASLSDKRERTHFWITTTLLDGLKEQLKKREQAIIFLNRRGVSFFVQCKSCSFVFSCVSCSVSLTLHNDNSMRCHYCGYKESRPTACSACKSTDLLNRGIGTQQLVSVLQRLLPTARIERADMDVTINRKRWKSIINAFSNREIDILVGTQTITKGYHFPHVTMVGIIWGDCNLHFPFYNAQEVALQQLIQVAGRAGRQQETSSVIIQIMQNHAIFDSINEVDYLSFYKQEIKQRTLVGYPPITRLAEIELKHETESIVEEESLRIAHHCMQIKTISTLGPAEPLIAKIKNSYSRKIYIKADHYSKIHAALDALDINAYKSSIYFTPQPLQ